MSESDQGFDIICLSHLKWEQTLFQRPQQIMRRLSQRHRIIYIANCSTRDFLRSVYKGDHKVYIGRDSPALFYVNVPYIPFTKYLPALNWIGLFIQVVVAKFMAWRLRFRDSYLWVYHPGYVKHARLLRHRKLIYDCMDLFVGFESATDETARLEQRLLRKAAIVFTGGRSLQKATEGVNPRTYCFPSGVEFDHFAKAALPETPIPEDIQSIKHPILGYFGAVDERIDYALVNYICEKRPDWSVVFLGPLINFDFPPVDQPNFHWLGRKEYALLPNYLKAFDVCLMPFVISKLTLHISPTKTPEYLSGGKPVVSTAIPDVIADYSDLVQIADSYKEFIARVDEVLRDPPADLDRRVREKAQAQSWDSIAENMERLVRELP
ncbi:MAG: glycosyltransferase [Candidatus Sumerlaeota bacterium]|nr:glycosyltransferase [Candidatus Sumerlaeota bacterium]